MMKKLLLLLSVIFITNALQAQVQQARWWYFGSGAGVDFNPTPSADPNGVLQTYEGCSSISSPIGSLYFYTDGSVVVNANHSTMTNGSGLTGGGSSTQSGQVIPYTGSSTKYYVFTQAQNVGTNGLRYSVVDMTLSSGLGAVTATKNIFLGNSFAEKVTGVKKSNGYWVCALKLPGDTLYAYEVTASGVNPVPVKSNTGINLSTNNFYGCMKANTQGTQLAAVHQGWTSAVHVFNFNKQTGMVTSTMTLTTTTGGAGGNTPYGVEFSPNGNLLYIQSWNVGDLKQYNLTAGTAAQISSSQVFLGSNSNAGGGSIQMGPDGKMYAARFGQTFISSITNPDVQGTGCGYTANAVSLSSGDYCRWGLPLFLGAFFGASVEVEDNCYGDTTYFTADTTNVDSMIWEFGDTASGLNNYAEGLLSVGHLYTDTGTYTVTLVVFNNNYSDTVTEVVYIYPRQYADLGPDDTTLCVGLEFTLDVGQPHATYEWHDGTTDSAYTVAYPDSLVYVTVFGVCDTVADTMVVNYFYPFDLDIQDDTSMCTYDNMNISTGLPLNQYTHQWSNGSTQNNINITTPGTYGVTVSEGICVYTDSVNIDYYPEVTVELGNDSSFCYEPLVNLAPKSITNVVSYKWSTNATSSNINVAQTDVYTVTVKGVGNYCQAIDSVKWSLWFEPLVDLGNDTSFCHDDILKLTPYANSAFPINYLWNDNSNNPSLNVNLVGLYWVEVSDENCAIRDTIIVNQYPKLDVSLGEDINTCVGKSVTLTPLTTIPVINYYWNDGSTNTSLNINGHGTYTVSVDNGLCDARDEINVFYFDYPEVEIGNDTAMCPGTTLLLDASSPFEIVNYHWNTGNNAAVQQVQAIDSVWYWVEATNVVCRSTDSIFITLRDVPNTFIGKDTAICYGDELTLSVIEDPANQSFSWNTGDSTQSITVSDTGLIVVHVNDEFCSTPGKIRVSYKSEPTVANVKLEAPETICVGESIDFDVYDPRFRSYLWQDGSTSAKFNVKSEGLYWIKATHDCGVVTDTVFIDKCECPIWVPTAFNPDGNDINDGFAPRSDCKFIEYKFFVYNRWGEEIFYSETPEATWDGMHLGSKANAGTYTWRMIYTAEHEGERIEDQKSGAVLLMR
jgi:gliding motility-associated-like protein